MRAQFGSFTQPQIKGLLRTLAAKSGLSFGEIVGAFAKRGTAIANDLLSVQGGLSEPVFMCGSDPYFTATVTDENGKMIPHRKLPGVHR
jgi:hypothetical protein